MTEIVSVDPRTGAEVVFVEEVRSYAQLLSDAIVAWTGWGRVGVPARDERLVIQEVSADAAVHLMPLVLELFKDFYSSDGISRLAI